jgi:hypothetical protein
MRQWNYGPDDSWAASDETLKHEMLHAMTPDNAPHGSARTDSLFSLLEKYYGR